MTDKPEEFAFDYESDLGVDVDALDYEWTRQASLCQKYGEESANAVYDRDKKKTELKVKRAELSLEIRSGWTEWGFTSKPTESAIADTIQAQDDIVKLEEEFNQMNHEVNRFYDIRSSFDQKGKALEYLSRLYLSGYWADPKIPAAAQTAYSDKGKDDLVKETGESLKRRLARGKEK